MGKLFILGKLEQMILFPGLPEMSEYYDRDDEFLFPEEYHELHFLNREGEETRHEQRFLEGIYNPREKKLFNY